MKGYGTIREVKSSKSVSVITDEGEKTYEQFDGTYGWKDLEGEIHISLIISEGKISLITSEGKKITLLHLNEAMYKKLTLSVRSDDEIEETVQKQLEATK